MKQPELIIFDVNETLLNLDPLKASINNAFNKEVADLWFARLLHYSLVETTTGNYHDFSKIAAAILQMMAKTEGRQFSEAEIEKILSPVTQLETYADVIPGLSDLKKAGIRLVAFSNGKPSVLQQQLENAGIAKLFDLVYSVEELKKYKPHEEAYKFVLRKTGIRASEACMVAAHGWDVYGASSAGLRTCFIERPGKVTYPLAKKPDLQLTGIDELSRYFD